MFEDMADEVVGKREGVDGEVEELLLEGFVLEEPCGVVGGQENALLRLRCWVVECDFYAKENVFRAEDLAGHRVDVPVCAC